MLVNLRDICAIAEQKNMAIASFNVPSLEATRAALDAAEESGYPVILSHAEGHDPFAPLDYVGPMMVALAECSSAQVCVHLDHCENLSYMRRALEMGFTGAMFDGSLRLRPRVRARLHGHARERRRPRERPRLRGRLHRSRPGPRLRREHGARHSRLLVRHRARHLQGRAAPLLRRPAPDPRARERAFGHARRIGRLRRGSGVSDEDYHRSIDAGIRKVNYYTYGVKYAGDAVRELVRDFEGAHGADAPVYWHDMTVAAYERMYADFKHVIEVFANGAAPIA